MKKKKWLSVALVFCLLFIITSCTPNTSKAELFKTLFSDGKYSEAYALYNDSIVGNSANEEQFRQFSNDFFAQVEDDLSEERITYDDAVSKIKEFENYMLIYSAFWNANGILWEIKSSKESFKAAGEAIDKKDFLKALEYLNKVSSNDKNYSLTAQLIDECKENYKAKLFAEADELVTKGDFADAIDLLNKANNASVTIAEVPEKLLELRKLYSQSCVDKAKELAANKDYVAAIVQLDIALEIMPENKDLIPLKQEYSEKIPVSLFLFTSVRDGMSVEIKKGVSDNFSNTHEKVIYMGFAWTQSRWDTSEECDTEYSLQKKYNRISGEICLPISEKSTDNIVFVEILVDGIVKYKTPDIKAGTAPIKFELDITQADRIVFRARASHIAGSFVSRYAGRVYIADVVVSKD